VDALMNNKVSLHKIWKDLIDSFGYNMNFIEILSRGSSMVTAHQAALNCKEIAKVYSEASSISTFRHGGIECLNDNTTIILITSDNKNLQLNVKFLDNLINKWKSKKVLHITNQNFDNNLEKIHKNSKMIIYRHNIVDNYLAPIMEIIILQLLFYKMAEKRGIEPGIFYFTKKITDEI